MNSVVKSSQMFGKTYVRKSCAGVVVGVDDNLVNLAKRLCEYSSLSKIDVIKAIQTVSVNLTTAKAATDIALEELSDRDEG